MGKSVRHTPVLGFAPSDKASKAAANRLLRRKIHLAEKRADTEVFPVMREVSEVRRFPKSPRSWDRKAAEALPELMRK